MSTLNNILNLLIHERNKLDGAINALGGTIASRVGSTGRQPRTPEQRAAQSEKMKQYWASRNGAKKTKRK